MIGNYNETNEGSIITGHASDQWRKETTEHFVSTAHSVHSLTNFNYVMHAIFFLKEGVTGQQSKTTVMQSSSESTSGSGSSDDRYVT